MRSLLHTQTRDFWTLTRLKSLGTTTKQQQQQVLMIRSRLTRSWPALLTNLERSVCEIAVRIVCSADKNACPTFFAVKFHFESNSQTQMTSSVVPFRNGFGTRVINNMFFKASHENNTPPCQFNAKTMFTGSCSCSHISLTHQLWSTTRPPC